MTSPKATLLDFRRGIGLGFLVGFAFVAVFVSVGLVLGAPDTPPGPALVKGGNAGVVLAALVWIWRSCNRRIPHFVMTVMGAVLGSFVGWAGGMILVAMLVIREFR